jgi:putative transcriptional regulator
MDSLQNHFIIAMPNLNDPYFERSVTFICEHNESGAMGLVINQPIDLSLEGMLKQIKIETIPDTLNNKPIFAGGPVARERGFVLHRRDMESSWASSVNISETISLTTSKDILEAIGMDTGPEHFLVSLGYAGWEAGQLEEELQSNAWLTIPADPDILFDTPIHKRWEYATEKLGINPWQITSDIGHA